MTTLTKKNSLVLEHIMALLAKAAYCRKRPTNENSNPEQVNTVDGAVEALKSM